jgi:hypothetical protein
MYNAAKQTDSMVQQEPNIMVEISRDKKTIHAYLTNNPGTFSVWPTRRKTHFMHCVAAEKLRKINQMVWSKVNTKIA